MEAETALVGAESGVVLHTVAKVHLGLTLVVNPNNAEFEDTVGLDNALDNLVGLKFGMLVVFFLNGFQNLADSLQVLVFARMFGLQVCHNFFYFHVIQFFMLNFIFVRIPQMYTFFLNRKNFFNFY